jgi:acyl-coenzyme A synthetase/AMP-(fatty) acid ligase
MLYERWRKIAHERRGEIALRDTASRQEWTFAQLESVGETWPASTGPIVFPQGNSPRFIFDLLAGWREQKIVCPLEPGQSLGEIAPPPGKCRHLKCTSGTNGLVRTVAFTDDQLAADAENIVSTMKLSLDSPNLGVISMAHSYGFSNLVLPLLLQGMPLVLVAAPLPEMIRRAAEPERKITLPAVPAMWRAWFQAGVIPRNITVAISAGAPLPLLLEQSVFQETGVKIHNFLGASECGGIAYDASPEPRVDSSFVGTTMHNVQLSLNPDGCLRVQGRSVGETYWPNQDPALGNGIFQTSDLAELNDGRVFLRGRLGDQINVAGRKVSPDQIENTLRTHEQVRECLVFGRPSEDSNRTEIIVAVVVGDVTETALKQFLLNTLPAWQVPREWKFVEALPVNARGKISRAEWRRISTTSNFP